MSCRRILLSLLFAWSAALPMSTQAQCVAPPTGLVHWWRAEGNGADIIGSRNGARMLGAGFAAGQSGQAFALDGVDDYVHVGMLGSIGLTETDPYTLSVWLNPLELTRTESLQVIASNYMGERGGTGDYYTFLLYLDSTLYYGVGERQLSGVNAVGTLTPGWQHIVGTYDGTTVALYINGVAVDAATRPFSGSIANTRGWNFGDFSPETNESHATLGGSPRNGALNGQIDELQIFDRALTAPEVYALFAAQSTGLCVPALPTLDIDANTAGSKYTAMTDGLLALRYLLGLGGTPLTAGALGNGATRDDAAILLYLDDMLWALDVDDNGVEDAATDGLIILRYLLGFRGDALIADALGPNAGRTLAVDIESWLATLTP